MGECIMNWRATPYNKKRTQASPIITGIHVYVLECYTNFDIFNQGMLNDRDNDNFTIEINYT